MTHVPSFPSHFEADPGDYDYYHGILLNENGTWSGGHGDGQAMKFEVNGTWTCVTETKQQQKTLMEFDRNMRLLSPDVKCVDHGMLHFQWQDAKEQTTCSTKFQLVEGAFMFHGPYGTTAFYRHMLTLTRDPLDYDRHILSDEIQCLLPFQPSFSKKICYYFATPFTTKKTEKIAEENKMFYSQIRAISRKFSRERSTMTGFRKFMNSPFEC